MYAISLYRYNVCFYGGCRGENGDFLSGRPRDLWHSIFRLSFCFLGATLVIFSAIATVLEFGRGFSLIEMGFLLALIVVGSGHGVEHKVLIVGPSLSSLSCKE